MIRCTGAIALIAAISASTATAATFTWTGDTDTTWGGANWDDGTITNAVAADEFTGSGAGDLWNYMSDANADTVFNGDDAFIIPTGSVINDFLGATGSNADNPNSVMPYFQDNTTVDIDGADIHWFANNWLPVKILENASMTINDSTVEASRGRNAGNAFAMGNDDDLTETPSLVMDNSTLIVNRRYSSDYGGDGSASFGHLELYATSSFTAQNNSYVNVYDRFRIDNDATATITDSTVDAGWNVDMFDTANLDLVGSTVNAVESFDINNSATMTVTDSDLTAKYIRLDSGSSSLEFISGTITLSASNSNRGDTFDGKFDWTGVILEALLTQTDASDGGTNIARRVAQGYFSIDGVEVDPTLDDSFDFTDPAVLASLNAELQTLAVNDRWFVVGYDETDPGANNMTLQLVPEPASLALLGLGGLLMVNRRRK